MVPDPFFEVKREQGNIYQIGLLISPLQSSKRHYNNASYLYTGPSIFIYVYYFITTTSLGRQNYYYFTSEEIEPRQPLEFSQARRTQVRIL